MGKLLCVSNRPQMRVGGIGRTIPDEGKIRRTAPGKGVPVEQLGVVLAPAAGLSNKYSNSQIGNNGI